MKSDQTGVQVSKDGNEEWIPVVKKRRKRTCKRKDEKRKKTLRSSKRKDEKRKKTLRSSQDLNLGLLNAGQMFLPTEPLELWHWSRG